MTYVTVKRASLWRETWQAVQQSFPAFLPTVLLYSLALSICNFLMQHGTPIADQARNNPDFFKQHPELLRQLLQEAFQPLLWLLPLFVFMSIGYYVFTVMYLRLAMAEGHRPDYSINGYFYWLGKECLKYARTFWILIPIVGLFIYFRSIIRYQLVAPLAVLRHGDELKSSWDLTKNNWWRIFGNYLLLLLMAMIIPYTCIFVLGSVSGLGWRALTHLIQLPLWGRVLAAMVYGLMGGISMMVFCIYSCICYRVLSQEAQGANR